MVDRTAITEMDFLQCRSWSAVHVFSIKDLRGGAVAEFALASAHISVVLLQDCWVAIPGNDDHDHGHDGDVDHHDDHDAGGCCCGEADLSLSSSIQPQLRITRSSPLTGNKKIISFLSKKINSFWFCFSGTLEEKGQFVTWKKSTFSAVIWDFLRRCLNIYH